MKQLSSKNYSHMNVVLRDVDTPFKLSANSGMQVSEYLTTKDNNIKHVKLTDVNGNFIVVLTTDIRRIEPVVKTKGLQDYVILDD